MSIDSRIRDLSTKIGIFFLGDAKELRENLTPNSIKWASIAETIVPLGATLVYISTNNGDLPPYPLADISAALTAEGAMRLALPQFQQLPFIKKFYEGDNSLLLVEPTGIVGKLDDAIHIYMKLLKDLRNFGNHDNKTN